MLRATDLPRVNAGIKTISVKYSVEFNMYVYTTNASQECTCSLSDRMVYKQTPIIKHEVTKPTKRNHTDLNIFIRPAW